MGIQISKQSYEKLINEDIEALEKSNCTKLEKEHIIDVLRHSINLLYSETQKPMEKYITDEEKAKELGKKYSNPCQGMGDCEFEATQAAIEMGEWKNKQCPSKNVIRKVLDIAYDHQYTDKDGMHNLYLEAEDVIEHWNEIES